MKTPFLPGTKAGLRLLWLLAFLLSVVGWLPAAGQDQFPRAIVVSPDSSASEAGLAVLRAGGNAVDAAVAVGFALAVTYPEAGNVGGGGFMLIRLADGSGTFIDFRETAPAASTAGMFLDDAGNVVPGRSTIGGLAVGVPGTVSGLLTALSRYGTMSRDDVMKRAIVLAVEGFRVDGRLSSSLASGESSIVRSPAAAAVFFRGGAAPEPGTFLLQPDLARTLMLIREKGAEGFYRGEMAREMVATVRDAGGILSMDDLSGYEAVERRPIEGTYRGYSILTAPPPSAGGIAVIQMLHLLDLFPPEERKARFFHRVASAARESFADRFEVAGDPDAVPMPVDSLISVWLARQRKMMLGPEASHDSDRFRSWPSAAEESGSETTHYCVVDENGTVVSATVSLNDVYGSKVFVGAGGFFLNNVMDDFTIKAGSGNLYDLAGGEPNSVAPGRRMVSSMAPTIVYRENLLRLVIGARGGTRIPTSIVQVISHMIDGGMTLEAAVSRPRIHHQWVPDLLYYEPAWSDTMMLNDLRSLGYEVTVLPSSPGRIQAVEFREGAYIGVSDPREGGTVTGY